MTMDRVLSRLSLDSPTPLMKQLPTAAAFALALVTIPIEGNIVTLPGRFYVGIILMVLATVLSITLPWRRLNRHWAILIPCMSLIAAGGLRVGTGGAASPHASILLLPFVWIATEEGRLNAVLAGLGIFIVLVVPILVSDAPSTV